MSTLTKYTIEHKGKTYGYWVNADGSVHTGIRSESNPAKTPYLKNGSKLHSEILAVILAKHAGK